MQQPPKTAILAALLAEGGHSLAFNILEIGALPVSGVPERFYLLLDLFPSSRVHAIEIDPALCETLNREARPGLRYYPCALGKAEESRALYETANPMCSSLYEPDERYADLYTDLDVMRLRVKGTVRTMTPDRFVRDHNIGPVDFIKMDIQGAELDVLRGSSMLLSSVLALVSEVEFVPLYKGQPLYGDIDAYLRERDFMLHRFLGFGGRVMKPLVGYGASNSVAQFMWADALFTCDLLDLTGLSESNLLKLAVLLDLYESCDAALYVMRRYDELRNTELGPAYLKLIMQSDVWTLEPGSSG